MKMKVTVTVVLLFAVFGHLNSLPREEKDPADRIKQLIDLLWQNIPGKLDVGGLKFTLDPNPLISGDLVISEVSLSGYKEEHLYDITFDKASSLFEFAFSFEHLVNVLETRLDLGGLLPLKAPFSLHFDLENVKIVGIASLAEDRKSVEDLRVWITLEGSEFEIKGVLSSEFSEALSEAFTKVFPKFFSEVAPSLSPAFSEFLKPFLNYLLDVVS